MIRRNPKMIQENALGLSIFKTELGWFGLLGQGREVIALKIGYSSEEKVRSLFRKEFSEYELENVDWYPELRERLIAYAEGMQDDFRDIQIRFLNETSFQKKVRQQTRAISYGQQFSYLDIARQAGSPRAARAVGNVMRTNPVPLIMPCHRVIASDGSLGGFSAPTGLKLKQKLIDMESAR